MGELYAFQKRISYCYLPKKQLLTSKFINLIGNHPRIKFTSKSSVFITTISIVLILQLVVSISSAQSGNYNNNRYVVIENQVFNNPSPVVYNGYDSVIYRNCVFQNRTTTSDAQVIHLTNIGLAKFEDCTFKNLRRTTYGDYHAINAVKDIDSLIINRCRFENISADGIQVGQYVYDDTINANINYVLIEYSDFINPANTSTENGIDWKGGCTDKGIIQNCTFSGFNYCNTSEGCTGANGEAIAIHYRLSRNLIIRNNTITDCNVGIAVAKGSAGGNAMMEAAPKSVLVTGNKASCNEIGIQAWEVENVTINNNIVSDAEYGVWLSTSKNVELNNNTVVNCWYNSLVEFVTTVGTHEYTNNLVVSESGGVWMDIPGSNNLLIEDISTVYFANTASKDYHLTAASEIAIGKGFNNGLTYDFDGETRLNDGLIDIGADEYWPGGSEPENIAPTANAGTDQSVTDSDLNGSQSVTISGSGSYDPDGSITSYSWRENSTQIATGVSPTVNLTVGTHTIQLVVTDNDGATGTDNVTITVNAGTVPNNAPTANAGVDQSVTDSDLNGSQPVTLNGSGSSDSDGSIAIYSWRENSTQIATGVSPTVNLTVGTHTIQLVVTDNDGATGTDNVTITVNAGTVPNNAPTANAGADQSVTDSDLNGSQPVTLNGSGSSDSDGSIASHSWRENSTQIATGVSPTVNLTVGTHTVQLVVTDNDGATGTDNVTIIVNTGTVTNNPPSISDQEFLVYEESIQTIIGTIQASDPDDDMLNFSIISGNESGMFEVGTTTGILSFNVFPNDFYSNNSFELQVEVKDNGQGELSDLATISINLVPEGQVYYIDPENLNGSSQNGTMQNPYGSWNKVSWVAGASYLQKRGTISYEDVIEIEAEQVYLGAYGVGANPIIQSQSETYGIKSENNRDITIKDLDISADNAFSCIYFLGENSDNILINGCSLSYADYGIRVINSGHIEIKGNKISNTLDAIFLIAEYAEINYNNFISNIKAINYNSSTVDSRISNNVFYDNEYGLIADQAQTVVYNNIFYLTTPTACAITHKRENCLENYNIFYPEQDGFINLSGVEYPNLTTFQNETGLGKKSMVQDPKLKNCAQNDFEILDNSPAIDAGIYIGLLEDMYGTTVPIGNAPDIGSFEKAIALSDNLYSVNDAEEQVKIYPNPSRGQITIENLMKDESIRRIEILDYTGRVVYSDDFESLQGLSKENLELSELFKGIYLMKLYSGDHDVIVKNVVIH